MSMDSLLILPLSWQHSLAVTDSQANPTNESVFVHNRCRQGTLKMLKLVKNQHAAVHHITFVVFKGLPLGRLSVTEHHCLVAN